MRYATRLSKEIGYQPSNSLVRPCHFVAVFSSFVELADESNVASGARLL